MKLQKTAIVVYFFSVIALFFYSYTQVDLSLTLSRQSVFQIIEKWFQYIGYFNRPLSTMLFLVILIVFFISYLLLLIFVKTGKISRKLLWKIIFISVGILTFSYNAFSYDFFNYIFYGKIITHYHMNPYAVKALDFPHDPMLSFMHWTQNTYPYGPFFLVLITPLSFLGFNFFLPTFFIFKLFTSACLLGSVWILEKIADKVIPKISLLAFAFFALSPLTLIEGVVSAHNDTVMMFFAILGVYLLMSKKRILGVFSLIASWQTKEATAFILIPSVFYFINSFLKRKLLNNLLYIRLSGIFMMVAFLYLATFREVQPWYFLWILPFVVFLSVNRYFLSIMIGLSMGLLLRYTPFLLNGNWDGNANQIKLWVTVITPLGFLIVTIFSNMIQFIGKKRS